MAKTTKPKKKKDVVEEVVTITPNVTQEPQVELDTPEIIPESEIAIVMEEPAKVEEVIIEEVVKEPEVVKPTYIPEPPKINQNLSIEEKIVEFLNKRGEGFVKMNDFLKSLFPLQKFNEPATWASQASSKQLRVLLSTMQSNGLITIANNRHLKLGTIYYTADEQKTKFYTLNEVVIEAKK